MAVEGGGCVEVGFLGGDGVWDMTAGVVGLNWV